MKKKHNGSTEPLKKSGTTEQRDKDKGHPLNHRNKRPAKDPEKQNASEAVQSRKARPHKKRRDGGGKPDVPPSRIVVTIGHGHPGTEPDTYDAAALLKSVLAAVEPRLDKGIVELAEAIHSAGEPGAGSETARAVRAVGRQITEALRAGVVDGMRVRERHLAQLAVIDRAAAQASDLSRLRARISAEIEHAGLRRVSDLADLSPFNLAAAPGTVPSSAGGPDDYELVTPAYVEIGSGRVVEHGWIKVAEALPMPGGKTHGRISREHRTTRRAEESEETTAISGDAEGSDERPTPPADDREKQGQPGRHQSSESDGASQPHLSNPTGPGTVPMARVLSERLTTDKTATTNDQPARRRH